MGQGLGVLSQARQDHGEAMMRFTQVGLQFKRSPVGRCRFVESFLLLQHGGEILVRLGELGFQLHGAPNRGLGVVEISQAVESGAEIIVCLGEVGLQANGSSPARGRLVNAVSRNRHGCQIVMSVGERGFQFQGSPQVAFGHREFPLATANRAEHREQLGIVGIRLQHPLIKPLGLGQLPGSLMRLRASEYLSKGGHAKFLK
jgi:hypothetical protein